MTISKEIQNLFDLFIEKANIVEYTKVGSNSEYYAIPDILVKKLVNVSSESYRTTIYYVLSDKYNIYIDSYIFTEEEQKLLDNLFDRLYKYTQNKKRNEKLSNLNKAIKEIRNATT